MSDRITQLERKLESALQTITAMQAHTKRVDVACVALSRNGVTDLGAADFLAAQIGQTESGRWVAFTDQGVPRAGDDADCTMGLDALVAEYKAQTGTGTSAPADKPASAGQVNPFQKGPNFNMTAQVILMKSDPELAEHFQYLAGIGRG